MLERWESEITHQNDYWCSVRSHHSLFFPLFFFFFFFTFVVFIAVIFGASLDGTGFSNSSISLRYFAAIFV